MILYKLTFFSPRKSVEETSWMGYLTTYLPQQVTDVFNQGRAFSTAYLPSSGLKSTLAIATLVIFLYNFILSYYFIIKLKTWLID